jgi:glucose-1-phosphate thymidylyltransferase
MKTLSKIFLSSTTSDLGEFRIAAREGLEGAGWHCVWMEGFTAQSGEPADYVERMIGECDAVVFLLGPCYGSIVPAQEISYTELEYNAAVKLHKPRLVFFTDDDFPVPANAILADKHTDKQELFRERLQKLCVRATFKRPEQLKALVAMAVAECTRTGQWRRHDRALPLPCLVLCGGSATRLAPLTRDTCKEAIPVAGVSALERMLCKLDADAVARDVTVLVRRAHERQIATLVEHVSTAMPVRVVPDSGSGPLKAVLQVSKQFDGAAFLLVAGDNIIEADLNRFLGAAQAKGCSGNLLYSMRTGQEASQYGVGLIDGASGLLREFREKQDVPSSILISTACYYFLYDDIMRLQRFLNDPTAASQNLGSFIAWLLAKNVSVVAHVTEDPWFDIGTREKLLRANAHYLRDRLDGHIEAGSQVKGPIIVEAGAKVVGNSLVGPNAYIGKNAIVEGTSEVRNSIVMDGARIQAASVSNAIVGANARVQGLIESFLVCNGAHVVREQSGYV